MALEWLAVVAALATAVALRPWRALGASGPPWVWLATWALLPLLWSADRHAHSALVQPLSGASLLLLMAGWPLAVLGLTSAALLAFWVGAARGR